MNTDYENGATVVTNGLAANGVATHGAAIAGTATNGAPPQKEVAVLQPAPAAAAPVAGEVKPSAQEAPPDETTGETTPATPVVRHSHNVAQQRLLIELQALVQGVEGAGEPLHSLLEAQGINSAYLVACRSIGEALDEAIAVRRQAMADQNLAVQQQAQAGDYARSTYAALRKVARTVLPNTSAHIALGLNEHAPRDLDLFLATARDAVTAAKQEPYASQLAGTTLGSDRLEAMEGALAALTTLIQMRQDADQAAVDATRARNATASEVRRYVRQLRVEIDLILRQHPEITAPVWF